MGITKSTTFQIICYTVFYHAMYYCPPIEKKISYLIKKLHNIKDSP